MASSKILHSISTVKGHVELVVSAWIRKQNLLQAMEFKQQISINNEISNCALLAASQHTTNKEMLEVQNSGVNINEVLATYKIIS
jgi:hypothetical protein